MGQAESNRVRVLAAKETVWAETPSSPAVKEIPIRSESLKGDLNTVVSELIRSDRMVDDQTKVGESASGDIKTELKFGDFDDLLEVGLLGTWDTALTIGSGDIDFASAGSGVQVLTGNSGDWADFTVGAWVRVKDSGLAANNGVFEVTAKTSTTLTVTNANGVSSSNTSAAISQRSLKNGTTKQSLFLEKQFQDLSSVNLQYTGMRVGTLSFEIKADEIILMSFDFLGQKATAGASVVGTITNASANQIMNATSNVGTLLENGSPLTTAIQGITIELNNNPRDLRGVSSTGAIGINLGRAEVSGEITAYFEDLTLYSKFLNQDQSSLVIPVTDPDGNTIVFSVLNLKFADGNVEAGGINQDVTIPLTYNGLRNATKGAVLQIDALAV